MTSAIRPIVLALLQRPSDGALLVTEHVSARGDRRVRPVGGGIEFGETARTALDREIAEELGTTLTSATHLSTFESVFSVDDVVGHEIVFVFRCEPADAAIYDATSLPILDAPHETAFWWTDRHPARLVPEALTSLLAGNGND